MNEAAAAPICNSIENIAFPIRETGASRCSVTRRPVIHRNAIAYTGHGAIRNSLAASSDGNWYGLSRIDTWKDLSNQHTLIFMKFMWDRVLRKIFGKAKLSYRPTYTLVENTPKLKLKAYFKNISETRGRNFLFVRLKMNNFHLFSTPCSFRDIVRNMISTLNFQEFFTPSKWMLADKNNTCDIFF